MSIKKLFLKSLGGSFLGVFFCFVPFEAKASEVTLAQWDFPTGSADALVDRATPENSAALLSVIGSTLTGFGTATIPNAAQAEQWDNGAGSKYWLFTINTTGYKNLLFSVKLSSSNAGPKDFVLQYRTPDADWSSVPNSTLSISPGNSFTTLSPTALPAITENRELLQLRLVMNSNLRVFPPTSTVSPAGVNRLDDLTLTGTPLLEVPPEEPSDPESLCTGSEADVYFTELYPYAADNNLEYAELYNAGDTCVDMSRWHIEDATTNNVRYLFATDTPNPTLSPQSYFIVEKSAGLGLHNTDPDGLILYNANSEKITDVTYQKAIRGLSYSFDGATWRFTSFLTPGEENLFDIEDEEEVPEAGSGIILNEIFPNPATDEAHNEFIELKNVSDQEQNLKGWSLIDASQKIFTFENDTVIGPGDLLTLSRSMFGFSLNNTGTESVSLLDPQSNILSEVILSGTQENFSYSWNGSEWHWTKKVTPGEENQFSKSPRITLTKGENGYADVPVLFQALVKNAEKPYRYSWDFGDGRKSTLAEPKHTYSETGEYKASVTVRSEVGTAEKNFTVTIKKYPKYPVLITTLSPNPEGTDTGKEWVEIKNFSNKSINLTGWKIATGSEDVINHPLVPNILLRPQQTLRLTRRHAAFSLPNEQGQVELRYPNNKASSITHYQEEGIDENATCTNQKDVCDFPSSVKEGKDSNLNTKTSLPDEPESLISLAHVSPDELPAIPNKKEVLQRVGADLNFLFNKFLLDASEVK